MTAKLDKTNNKAKCYPKGIKIGLDFGGHLFKKKGF